MNIPNFHVLVVTFLGATNNSPKRVKIHSPRFKQSVILSWNYDLSYTYEIAADYLTKKGFDIVGKAEGKDCYYIISNTFEPLKK